MHNTQYYYINDIIRYLVYLLLIQSYAPFPCTYITIKGSLLPHAEPLNTHRNWINDCVSLPSTKHSMQQEVHHEQ